MIKVAFHNKLVTRFLLTLTLTISFFTCYATPSIYLFLGSGPAKRYQKLLQNPKINGAQITYSWRTLEPQAGMYNFSAINADLVYLHSLHKVLFIQIQDRSSSPNVTPVPDYLLNPQYGGGIAPQIASNNQGKPFTQGWIAKQWLPSVRERFQLLLIKLATQFDGKIKGVSLSSSSITLGNKSFPPQFNCDRYFHAVLINLTVLRAAFKKSLVSPYVTLSPCDLAV